MTYRLRLQEEVAQRLQEIAARDALNVSLSTELATVLVLFTEAQQDISEANQRTNIANLETAAALQATADTVTQMHTLLYDASNAYDAVAATYESTAALLRDARAEAAYLRSIVNNAADTGAAITAAQTEFDTAITDSDSPTTAAQFRDIYTVTAQIFLPQRMFDDWISGEGTAFSGETDEDRIRNALAQRFDPSADNELCRICKAHVIVSATVERSNAVALTVAISQVEGIAAATAMRRVIDSHRGVCGICRAGVVQTALPLSCIIAVGAECEALPGNPVCQLCQNSALEGSGAVFSDPVGGFDSDCADALAALVAVRCDTLGLPDAAVYANVTHIQWTAPSQSSEDIGATVSAS